MGDLPSREAELLDTPAFVVHERNDDGKWTEREATPEDIKTYFG